MLRLQHWIVQIHRSQIAFIRTAGEKGDPATAYYMFPADPLNLLKETLYLIQTFIANCTMVRVQKTDMRTKRLNSVLLL